MPNVADSYRANYDAITAATKGAAPAIHVVWSAVALTIFEAVESWVHKDSPKRMQS